jgi:hypothetical protein
MDLVGTILSLIDLSQKLYNNFQIAKNAPETVKKLTEELSALHGTLKSVHSAISEEHLEQLPIIAKLGSELSTCLKGLQRLDKKFSAKSEGKTARFVALFRQFKWPFEQDETREYILEIERLKAHLSIELQAYQLYDTFLHFRGLQNRRSWGVSAVVPGMKGKGFGRSETSPSYPRR